MMEHKIRYTGSKKAGWTCECSCGESEDYRKAFARENCDRNHNDEWVEVDEATWDDLLDGTRLRREWEKGCWVETLRRFVHRDDLPDPDAEAVDALRNASWNIPRLDNSERPDPLPGLPEARDLLTALHEAGFDVVRKAR